MAFTCRALPRARACATLVVSVSFACAEERNALDTGTITAGAGNTAGQNGSANGGDGATAGGTNTAGQGNAGSGASSGGSGGSAGMLQEGGDAGLGGEAGWDGNGPVACASQQPDPSCTCHHHDDHDYWVCKTSTGSTHDEAKSSCEAAGMALVEISGAVEDSFVYSVAYPITPSYWIGATDAAPTSSEGNWVWLSGSGFWTGTSSGDALGYAAWRHGEPNDGGNCASVEIGDVWDDRACADQLGFVCEAPGGSSTPEPFTCGETNLYNCTCTENDGHEYVYCNYNQVWPTARERCKSIGMNLVQIDSDAENTWIMAMTGNDAVWTAGNDRALEDEWRWDGTNTQFWQGNGTNASGVAVGDAYTDWNGTNEPNDYNGGQDCMVLQSDGSPNWDDLECGAGRRFVCESG